MIFSYQRFFRKKQMNKFYFTTKKPQLVLVCFLGEIEDNKKTSRNQLTFRSLQKSLRSPLEVPQKSLRSPYNILLTLQLAIALPSVLRINQDFQDCHKLLMLLTIKSRESLDLYIKTVSHLKEKDSSVTKGNVPQQCQKQNSLMKNVTGFLYLAGTFCH